MPAETERSENLSLTNRSWGCDLYPESSRICSTSVPTFHDVQSWPILKENCSMGPNKLRTVREIGQATQHDVRGRNAVFWGVT